MVFADVATPYRLDDMMSILFPHLCEDVEFLIPPEADVEMRDFSGVPDGASATNATSPSHGTSSRLHVHVRQNAVAGPSRLG